jgi:hypothetical protein
MTPEEILKLSPSTATARQMLLIIAIAVEDLEKAVEGNLTTYKGSKVIPDMGKWSHIENKVCYACLAGCALVSRFKVPNFTSETAYFLDSCRFIPLCKPGYLRMRFGHSFNGLAGILDDLIVVGSSLEFSSNLSKAYMWMRIAQRKGIRFPDADISYSPGKAEDVLEYMKGVLNLNSGLLLEVSEVEVVSLPSVSVSLR